MNRYLFGPVIISILLVSIFFPAVSHGAFGISPPYVNADHLVPGAIYKQTVWLVQSSVDEDMKIKATLDISDKVKPWIALDKGMEFTIPKGTRQFPVEVQISVPKDTDLAVYNGSLSFTGAPSQSGQVTIALGAQVSINMVVGNDVYRKISVPVVKLLDVEEGWDPKVYVKFVNDGNVPESFTGATYELLDKFGGVRLAFAQKNKGFEEVPPFSTKELTMDFPIGFHLGIGEYWGKVDFYQDDTLVASQKTVFTVLPAGSLSSRWQRVWSMVTNHWKVEAGAVGILAIGGFSFGMMRRRRRRRV